MYILDIMLKPWGFMLVFILTGTCMFYVSELTWCALDKLNKDKNK